MDELLIEFMEVLKVISFGKKKMTQDIVTSKRSVDKSLKKKKSLDLLWVDCKAFNKAKDDPMYHFWRYVNEGRFSNTAYVVFMNVRDSASWRDLSPYCYIKFGDVVLVVFDKITNPGVKPSQKGMFLDGS